MPHISLVGCFPVATCLAGFQSGAWVSLLVIRWPKGPSTPAGFLTWFYGHGRLRMRGIGNGGKHLVPNYDPCWTYSPPSMASGTWWARHYNWWHQCRALLFLLGDCFPCNQSILAFHPQYRVSFHPIFVFRTKYLRHDKAN